MATLAANSTTLSPATKNRLASLFQSFPKFGKGRKEDNKRGGRAADENADPVPLAQPIGGGLSRGGSYSANSSPAKTAAVTTNGCGPPPLSRPPSGLQRTRSMSSANGFSSRGCSERGSYRGGRGTSSRYMQADPASRQTPFSNRRQQDDLLPPPRSIGQLPHRRRLTGGRTHAQPTTTAMSPRRLPTAATSSRAPTRRHRGSRHRGSAPPHVSIAAAAVAISRRTR